MHLIDARDAEGGQRARAALRAPRRRRVAPERRGGGGGAGGAAAAAGDGGEGAQRLLECVRRESLGCDEEETDEGGAARVARAEAVEGFLFLRVGLLRREGDAVEAGGEGGREAGPGCVGFASYASSEQKPEPLEAASWLI